MYHYNVCDVNVKVYDNKLAKRPSHAVCRDLPKLIIILDWPLTCTLFRLVYVSLHLHHLLDADAVARIIELEGMAYVFKFWINMFLFFFALRRQAFSLRALNCKQLQ